MPGLLESVGQWRALLAALIIFGFAPGAVLRIVVLAYPRRSARREEVVAELYSMPVWARPRWVFEQMELALFTGFRERRTHTRLRKLGEAAEQMLATADGRVDDWAERAFSMASAFMGTAVCPKCGLDRADDRSLGEQRPPCPGCGERSVQFSLHAFETLPPPSVSVSVEMTPGRQTWDWRARWEQMLRELDELTAPRAGGMSAEEVHAARHRLHQFYISAFHLKDALKKQTSRKGDVESAINSNPELALLADLANCEKHDGHDPNPRYPLHSGHEPKVKNVSGVSLPGGGWRVVVRIEHGGKDLDGLDIAQTAVDAWRRVLTGWNLL